ncbi:hypothetical protein ACFFRR_003815 [Megaselia abdita]
MCRLISIIVVLLAVFGTGHSYNRLIKSKTVEGCSLATEVELGRIDTFKVTAFTLNVPKNNELLRLKTYFRGLSPTIIIQYGQEPGMTFGKVDNMTTYGIFEKYSDFTDVKPKPRISKRDVRAFSESFYTEMDIILTKDGRFTVYVHGDYVTDTLDLSFKKVGVTIDRETLTVKFGASNGKSEFTRFLFDCPWKASYLWTVLPKS